MGAVLVRLAAPPPGSEPRARAWSLTARGDDAPRIVESDAGPYTFSPLLAALDLLLPTAVVFRGDDLSREVLLVAWSGVQVTWVRSIGSSPMLGPAGFLQGLAQAHSIACADVDGPGESDAGLLRRLAPGLAESPPSPEARVPSGLSSWRRLQDHLAMREAIAEANGQGHLGVVRDLCGLTRRDDGPVASRGDGPKRVLVLSHELSWSGAPMVLLRTISALVADGIPWSFTIVARQDGPIRADFQVLGVPVRVVERKDTTDLLACVDDLAPDLIVANTVTLYQEVLLLRWKGLPVAWWIHEGLDVARGDGHTLEIPELAQMVRAALAVASVVIFAAEDTRRQYEVLCPGVVGRTYVVPNPVDVAALDASKAGRTPQQRADVRSELGLAPGDLLFLCVGGIERRKNQAGLVDAFQRMLNGLPEGRRDRCRLVMLGRPLRESGSEDLLERILASIEPRNRARILHVSNRPSILPILLAADVHVLVSTTESSPLIHLEAPLLGIPCLASAVHGIGEVVIDGETGFLVDPRDPSGIAQRLLEIVRLHEEDPAALAAVADRAAARIRVRHDHRRVAREIVRVLDSIGPDVVPSKRLQGASCNRLLSEQLVLHWAIHKRDAAVEAHLVRAPAHRLYGFELELPSRCPGSSRAMVGERVLVTGGAGMIGSVLVRRLLARGAEVLIIDDGAREQSKDLPPDGRLVLASCSVDADAARQAVRAFRPEVAFHLAARTFIPECERDPDDSWRVNVGGTRAILEACAVAGMRRFVLASTGAVYRPSASPHVESDPIGPIDVYGETKLAAENIVREFAPRLGITWRIARIFNTYGPRPTNLFLIPRIVSLLASGTRELRLGNLDAIREFNHVDDVVEALLRLADLQGGPGVIVNVGNGLSISVRQLVALFEDLIGAPLDVKTDASTLRPRDRERMAADPSRLRYLTGFVATTSLKAGLAAILNAALPQGGTTPQSISF